MTKKEALDALRTWNLTDEQVIVLATLIPEYYLINGGHIPKLKELEEKYSDETLSLPVPLSEAFLAGMNHAMQLQTSIANYSL